MTNPADVEYFNQVRAAARTNPALRSILDDLHPLGAAERNVAFRTYAPIAHADSERRGVYALAAILAVAAIGITLASMFGRRAAA